MTNHRRSGRRVLAGICALGTAIVLGACTTGDDEASGKDDTTVTTAAPFQRHTPTITPVAVEVGAGINQPQPAPAIPDGYVEEEYFIEGTATGFDAVETPDDGRWVATPGEEADYRTRVIVRRPADAAAFSGTVLVEWFNVSALEAAPDWGYLSGAIVRNGDAYVGVSTQAQGVIGGDTILDLNSGETDGESDTAAAADNSGLTNIDPVRYGTLAHPGDAFAFDIFSQVGQSLVDSPELLLGDLKPDRVIAMGESQSSMFLTTLINAVHPLAPVYDGFLVHSRGALVPALDGTYVRNRQGETPADQLERGVLIRDDLDVPVMIVEAETDLTVLGYVNARQPDTDRIRTWEVAGTSHADSETLRAVVGGPRDPKVGNILGCGSINSGPHKEVLRAALHHLTGWVGGGAAPPKGERLEVTDGETVEIVRGPDGNALGGVRNPMVDVPAAVLSGDPPGGGGIDELTGSGGDICLLFGQTVPFDSATITSRYGSADAYFDQFGTSAQQAVAAGFLLQPDADALVVDMEPNRALFG